MKTGYKTIGMIALLLLMLSSGSYAKTSITRTGCTVEVSMKIAFYGDGVNRTQIEGWLSYAQTLWSGKWTPSRFGNCSCPVKFNFTYAIMKPGEDCFKDYKDYHCINVLKLPPSPRHISSVRNGAVPGTGFTTKPYFEDDTGTFDSLDDNDVVAHEIGHLMGLDDEYFGYKVEYILDPEGRIAIKEIDITYPPTLAGKSPIPSAIREKIVERVNSPGYAPLSKDEPQDVSREEDLQLPGAPEDGIMSKLGRRTYAPSQDNINDICKNNKIDCPNTCCCGNGFVDAWIGEECDKAQMMVSCPTDEYGRRQYCNDKCKCQANESAMMKTTTTSTSSTSTTTTSSTTTSKTTTTRATTTTTSTTRKTASTKATTTTIPSISPTTTSPAKVACSGTLHSDPNCDGACAPPYACTRYEGTECYECACNLPDLYITALSARVSKSASTRCTTGDYQTCTTTCMLAAEASIKVKNKGKAAAETSVASVSIDPNVGIKTTSIERLEPGQTSETKTLTYTQTGTVDGTKDSCLSLSWWTSEYTATAAADMLNAVKECDETNNQAGAKTSAAGG